MADFLMALLDTIIGAFFPPLSKGKIIYKEPIGPVQPQSVLSKLFPSIFPPEIPNRADIDNRALQEAAQNLKLTEGYRLDVYVDTRNILTVGIGHKVTAADKLSFGQKITVDQLNAFFNRDIATAFKAAREQALELNKYEASFIAALTEVNFQLGTNWRSKFFNTWKILKSGDWRKAVQNLQKSEWYRQTPQRVANFAQAIQDAYT